jgi:hypothetical protein
MFPSWEPIALNFQLAPSEFLDTGFALSLRRIGTFHLGGTPFATYGVMRDSVILPRIMHDESRRESKRWTNQPNTTVLEYRA